MATKYVDIEGYIKYPKFFVPDEFRGAKKWKTSFYPKDKEQWDKYNSLGLNLKIRTDTETNEKYVVLSRPKYKTIKETIVEFTPPAIYDKNGNVLVEYVDEEGDKIYSFDKGTKEVNKRGPGLDVTIGNGTLVTVRLSVYGIPRLGDDVYGHRLDGVRILDLIAYDPDGKLTENQKNEAEVEPSVSRKAKVVEKSDEDPNDEMPW